MAKKHKQPNKKAVIATRILIAALILATSVAAVLFIRAIIDKRTLIDKGEEAVAIVNTQNIDNHVNRSGSIAQRTISYTFNSKEAQEKVTNNEFTVSKTEYEKYPAGSEIPVTYLPSDPSMNAPTVSLQHMSPMTLLFTYYLGIIGACTLFTKIGKLLRNKYKIAKEPGVANYLLSLGVFISAVVAGMTIAVLISKLVSLLLS